MKKIIKRVSLFLIMLIFCQTMAFSAAKKSPPKAAPKYLRPLSIALNNHLAPNVFIYTPASNYRFMISTPLEFGLSFEYRFAKAFALENGFYANAGFQYRRNSYLNTYDNVTHNIDLFNIDLFLQHRFSAKFYFPTKKLVKEKIRFMFRLGFTFEYWTIAYYIINDNGSYQSRGNLFDASLDGPNAFGERKFYRPIYTRLNVGPHIGFGFKVIQGKHFAIIPEIGYTFFILPITDGSKGGIKGHNALIIRNDGSNDNFLKDYKMQISLGFALQFSIGTEGDNLYDLVKAAPKRKPKNKKINLKKKK